MRAWLLLVLASCGPSTSGSDAGADAGPPGSAALPMLEPCPAGWRAIGTEPTTCDPWPEGGPAACAPHEAHFPGEPACRAPGAACTADGWPADLPSTGVVYVRAGAPFGGDGTRALPFATIGDALAAATDIVAIAAGTYDEAIVLDRSVTLTGACAEQTILAASTPASIDPTVYAGARGVILRNLSIGGNRPGLIVARDASAELTGVVVRGAESAGIVALPNAELLASELLVRATRGDNGDGAYGFGMQIEIGARVELRRAAIVENRGGGIVVAGAPSEIVLEDVAIAGTVADPIGGGDGRGMEIGGGAIVRASRLVLDSNAGRALTAFDPGTEVTLEDSHAVRARELVSQDGARLVLRRMSILDGLGAAILATRAGRLSLEDLVIARIGPDAGDFGRAIQVQTESQGDGSRIVVEEATELGIAATGAGTALALSDVAVIGTRPRASDGRGGHAVLVEEGARLSLVRARIEGASEAGAVVGGPGSEMSLVATVVRGTLARQTDGRYGLGINAERGALLTAQGLTIEDCRDTGIQVTAAQADLSGVVVQRTLERACARTTCTDYTFGFGVASSDGAQVAMRDFVVADNALCGLLLATGGTMDLARGEVRGHPIGANVQTEGFDVARISDDVVYSDNDRNLDASAALGVPEPLDPL